MFVAYRTLTRCGGGGVKTEPAATACCLSSGRERLRRPDPGHVLGLRLEHRLDLLAQLRRVRVAMNRLGMLSRRCNHLVLFADDRERAVSVALKTPAVSHHSGHIAPFSLDARISRTPRIDLPIVEGVTVA